MARKSPPDLNSEKVREKLRGMYRYMLQAAIEKRAVPYLELANVFGETRASMSFYAATIGDICRYFDEPPLNALIIEVNTGMPNAIGFKSWCKSVYGEERPDWGTLVAKCWSHFQVPTVRIASKKYFSGSTVLIDEWFDAEYED